MIKLACKIPKKVVLACSGGRDSMSTLEFLIKGKRDVTIAYYDHGTIHGSEALEFLKRFCEQKKLKLIYDTCNQAVPLKMSKEEFWRNKRYEFFKSLEGPIVMGHHLDDAVEWWIFSSLRGNSQLIPVERNNPHIIRPFLITEKNKIHKKLNKFPHIEDPSNENTCFARNYIRHKLGPLCLNVNPGIKTTIRNLYLKDNAC